MGYCASGDGVAVFKKEANIIELSDILESKKSEMYALQTDKIEYDIVDDQMSMWHSDERYDEDDVLEFLEVLTPYISEGQMEFTGEDGAKWRFRFNPNSEEWEEQSGNTVYASKGKYSEDSNFGEILSKIPEDIIVTYLSNCGYTVEKNA